MKGVRGRKTESRFSGFFRALALSNAISIGLFAARVLDAGNDRHGYLLWNLFLAWLPFVFAWWLGQRLRNSSWLTYGNVALTLLWLGFLPNSFYLVSDLIHLDVTGEVSLLYDIIMFFSFIFNGFVAGFLSVILVHYRLLERVRPRDGHLLIGLVLLMCGFAIYLGRYLRWNTWDVLVNPAGILFDVSERVVNPVAHPQSFLTTFTFFAVLASVYGVIFQLVNALLKNRR